MTDLQYAVLISFLVGFLLGSVYEWFQQRKENQTWRELAVKYKTKYKELKLKGLKHGQ